MIVINDRDLPGRIGNIEIVNRVGRREITHAMHDIDGTYSLIRQWRPVMSRSLWYAMSQGLKGDYDSVEKVKELKRDHTLTAIKQMLLQPPPGDQPSTKDVEESDHGNRQDSSG